jgi:hypothetical protein
MRSYLHDIYLIGVCLYEIDLEIYSQLLTGERQRSSVTSGRYELYFMMNWSILVIVQDKSDEQQRSSVISGRCELKFGMNSLISIIILAK